MIKAILLIGGKRYDITNFLKNWDEVEMSAKRKDLGGVVRTFSNKFEFVKGAYDLIEAEYLANYTKASAVLIIAVLNDQWTYNEKFRCQLDFSTYQSDGSVITLNAIDDSIAATINANKSQVYDIPVDELKSQELYYDRLTLKNRVVFYVSGSAEDETEDKSISVVSGQDAELSSFPVAYGDPNFPVKGIVEVNDSYGIWSNSTNENLEHYFVKTLQKVNIKLKLAFSSLADIFAGVTARYFVVLRKWSKSDHSVQLDKFDINLDLSDPYKWKQFDKEYDIELEKDNVLTLTLEGQQEGFERTFKVKIKDFDMNISYIGRNRPVNIDAFTPSKLLTSILHKMGLPQTTGMIEEGNMPIPWMLAAESIRGITNAKVHTSFKKFADFAKSVLGYDYEIVDNNVVFKHVSSYYDESEVKELEYVNSFEISVQEDRIYSGVEVGFEKKDYDEINGRDEFHFTNSYSTSLSINDNILKLISPYRADCYGIEFLAQKREEETKDDSSDNDLFIVDAKKSTTNSYLILNRDRGKVTGVLFPESVFNIVYSPRRMLNANKRYIGACTNRLDFTASNGNADVILDGENEKESVSITEKERLFRIENFKVDTVGIHPFMATYKGLISILYSGREYQGYISDITEIIGKSQTVSYTLISKNIV